MDKKIFWNKLVKINQEGDITLYSTSDTGKTIFLKPKDPFSASGGEEIKKGNFELYTNLALFDESGEPAGNYEALVLEGNYAPSFKNGLMLFMASLSAPMKQSLDAISAFLRNSSAVQLEDVLGAYAELIVLKEVKNCTPRHDKSNFDLDYGQRVVEVKSISTKESAAWFSDTQLTSDSNAIIVFVELIETNEGVSLYELAQTVQSAKHERYEWIMQSSSNLLHEKYEAKRFAIFAPSDFCAISGETFKSSNPNLKFITAKIRFRINPEIFRNSVSEMEEAMAKLEK